MEIGVNLGAIRTTDIRIKRHIAYKVTKCLDRYYKSYIQDEPKVSVHLLEAGHRSVEVTVNTQYLRLRKQQMISRRTYMLSEPQFTISDHKISQVHTGFKPTGQCTSRFISFHPPYLWDLTTRMLR